jgi:voltage-gated potassium channel
MNLKRSTTGSLAAATLRSSGGDCDNRQMATLQRRPRRREGNERAFELWLSWQTQRLDPLMAFLGIVFALLAAFQLADTGLGPGWTRALDGAAWAIWGVFVIEFAAKLVAAPSTPRFLRRNWLAVLMLLVPTLRLLRFGALLRLGRALPAARVVSTSYRATGVARRLLRSRAGFLGAVASVATLAVAQLAWLAERGHQTFATFGDALLWSAASVIAMQADPVPATWIGRLVMLAAFAVGLVLVATLAGTVGAYLLEERQERAQAERPDESAQEP